MPHQTGMIEVSYYHTYPEKDQEGNTKYFKTFDEVKTYYGEYYDQITFIFCNECDLTELPELPSNLVTLYCCWNELKVLPKLPSTLRDLYCAHNEFTSFPELPEGLTSYNGGDNNYGRIENLPMSLTSLTICNSKIEYIPDLSEYTNLTTFHCSNCGLVKLPELPLSLNLLICDGNKLTSLLNLPSGLGTIYAYGNQLVEFMFPDSIDSMDISNNQLTTIPPIPKSLNVFAFKGNPLKEPCRIYDTKIIINGFHHFKYSSGNKILSFGNEPDTDTITKLNVYKKY